jgi:hypothetical protein
MQIETSRGKKTKNLRNILLKELDILLDAASLVACRSSWRHMKNHSAFLFTIFFLLQLLRFP